MIFGLLLFGLAMISMERHYSDLREDDERRRRNEENWMKMKENAYRATQDNICSHKSSARRRTLFKDPIVQVAVSPEVENTRRAFAEQKKHMEFIAVISHSRDCNIFDCGTKDTVCFENVPDKIVGVPYAVDRKNI